MRHIRIGVIGGGWVTATRHLPALRNCPQAFVSVIVGQNQKNVETLRRRFRLSRMVIGDATKDASWLAHCDAAVIGTDPFSHFSLVKYCLEHNKHVLVEKPFSVSRAESEQLVVLAKEKNLRLAVVHNFQFSSSAKALERDIREGKLGAIKSLEGVQYSNPKRRLPSWYERLPWGLYFDESPHLLYLLEGLAGSMTLKDASAFRSREGMNTPAAVHAAFVSDRDIPVSLHLNFTASVSEWFLVANGEKCLGILDIFRDIYFSLPNDGKHGPFDILRTSRAALLGHFRGVFRSGIRVLGKSYFCGNDEVVGTFLRSIAEGTPLGRIDGTYGARINGLQFEIMERASLF